MAVKEINRNYLLGGLLLFTLLFLLLRFGNLAGRFGNNIGFALLHRAMIAQDIAGTLDYAAAAEPIFTRTSGVDPGNLAADRGLGLSSGMQNNINNALQTFDSLGVQAAEDYSLLGDAAITLNDREQAIFWYKQALELKPDLYTAWMKLGDTYEKTGAARNATAAYAEAWAYAPAAAFKPYVAALLAEDEIGKAEEILQSTLNSNLAFHERLWGWHTLGQLQQEQERWDDARAVYLAGLKEYEQDPSLLVNLGWLLYEKDRDAAVTQFETALMENPGSGAGYFAMGQLMANEKNYAAAEDWFRSALEREDTNPRWQLVRANTLRQAGNHDLAVQAYLETIDQYPAFVAAYYELANTYRLLDAPEKALQILDQANARSLRPPNHYYLPAAEIYIWGGRPKQAVDTYRELLDRDPDNPEALKQLKQLQNE